MKTDPLGGPKAGEDSFKQPKGWAMFTMMEFLPRAPLGLSDLNLLLVTGSEFKIWKSLWTDLGRSHFTNASQSYN